MFKNEGDSRALETKQQAFISLQPLFMSSENEGSTRATDPPTGEVASEVQAKGLGEKQMEEKEEEKLDSEDEWSEVQGKDCVVCQNAPLNRVLLPCRHACVCDNCVSRLQHCPMCRAFVMESFALCQNPPAFAGKEEEEQEEENKDVEGNGDHEEWSGLTWKWCHFTIVPMGYWRIVAFFP